MAYVKFQGAEGFERLALRMCARASHLFTAALRELLIAQCRA
jgi:hypothetical protein